MKKNLGSTDRFIRILIAVVVAALYVSEVVVGQWGTIILVIAGILVLTAVAGFCPLYSVFGFKTCKAA